MARRKSGAQNFFLRFHRRKLPYPYALEPDRDVALAELPARRPAAGVGDTPIARSFISARCTSGSPQLFSLVLWASCFRIWRKLRILLKAEPDKLRRIALHDGRGNVSLLHLFKLEVDRAIAMHRCQQEPVDLGARFPGLRSLCRKRIANSARGADNPAGQFA